MGPIWDVFANYITPGTGGHHAYTIREFWDCWVWACQTRANPRTDCGTPQQIWGIYFDHGVNMDSTQPTGSISLNNGASSTTTNSVTLTLTFGDTISGVSSVRYSNDGIFDNEPWEAASASKAWTLTGGTGTRTVYYQVQDNAGLASTFSDSIDVISGPGGGGGPCRPGCPIRPSSTSRLRGSSVTALNLMTMTDEQEFPVQKPKSETKRPYGRPVEHGQCSN